MLKLAVYDGETTVELEFEHSLRNLSKWESKSKKSWWATNVKEHEDLLDYFACMLVDPNVDPTLVLRLSPEQTDQLSKYINDEMTATRVPPSDEKNRNRDVWTTELLYWTMSVMKINWEAQDWHLNRLMTLIALGSYKSQPEQKPTKGRLLQTWDQIQRRNKEQFGISG